MRNTRKFMTEEVFVSIVHCFCLIGCFYEKVFDKREIFGTEDYRSSKVCDRNSKRVR